MKHYKSVEFLSIFRMSSPPIENFLATVLDPVSGEISDLCENFDLILFVSYFASLNKGIKFDDYFFDECCVS